MGRPPAEEMMTLHTNIPERASEREIKEIWRTENPNRNPDDFEGTVAARTWAAETKTWREEFFTRASDRWKEESPNLPALDKVDQKIGSSLALNDGQANKTYASLVQRFDDTHLLSSMLPIHERYGLKTLVADAREQILRNTDNLAVVVKSAKGVAGDELAGRARQDAISNGTDRNAAETAARTEWETKSELYKALDDIEKLLPDWEKLFADKPLPEAGKVQELAVKFDRAFAEFESKHAKVYNADSAPPYLNYQLPATMSALSEKIASQFAAHVGQPSFSAAYTLMMEVPHSGTYEESKKSAKELIKKPLAEGFKVKRDEFIKNLKNKFGVDESVLKADFDTIDGFAGNPSLGNWQNAYNDVGSGDAKKQKKALSDLYTSTAQLAFQFKHYNEAVDRFLIAVPEAKSYGETYLATLDGFVTALTEKVANAEKLLGS